LGKGAQIWCHHVSQSPQQDRMMNLSLLQLVPETDDCEFVAEQTMLPPTNQLRQLQQH